MTTRKDLKRRIRARQEKTGESYTTARVHVLRARENPEHLPAARLTGVVLNRMTQTIRLRPAGTKDDLVLRTTSLEAHRTAPGQLLECTINRAWQWRGTAFASGSVERAWTDVPALGLEPLPLSDRGVSDLRKTHEPYRSPDPYAEMWEFLTSAPRRAFEFDGIAWGLGVGVDADDDDDPCLVTEAAEIRPHDPAAAHDLLMKALVADLRCIDAHAHLGNLAFEYSADEALVHYDIALGIGELSLSPDFNDMLPWGHLFNRPFLRALHGRGLCLWRLGRLDAARHAFERLLSLNPADHQGARFCWDDVRHGRPWNQAASGSET